MTTEQRQTDERLFYGRLKAAKLLDLSPSHIDSAIRSGKIRARRVGRRVLISHDDLLGFVESQTKQIEDRET